MQRYIEVNHVIYVTWMLKIPPFGDEEEEITTIHLKIKLFSGLNHFITSIYFSCYSVFELQLYGLQVKQRFEVLKKRRVPGSFTEQGKNIERDGNIFFFGGVCVCVCFIRDLCN